MRQQEMEVETQIEDRSRGRTNRTRPDKCILIQGMICGMSPKSTQTSSEKGTMELKEKRKWWGRKILEEERREGTEERGVPHSMTQQLEVRRSPQSTNG